MRDRLIELLEEADAKVGEYIRENDHMDFVPTRAELHGVEADHLLANDVIVPPCKEGDTVYWLNFYNDLMLYRDKYYEAEVVRIVVTRFGVSCVIRVRGEHATYEIPDVEFGKTVFLTREAAEQALKEKE